MINFLLHAGHESTFGLFHPVLVHFPIVLLSAALVCDLLNAMGKPTALTVGHWMVIAALVFCIPTILSGLEAAEMQDLSNTIIAKHRSLGITTGVMTSLYSGLRISVMTWKIFLPAKIYVLMSLVMVCLVSWTADYGGLISHGTSIFDVINTSFE